MILQSKTDAELITEFIENKNEKAFDILLRRHYQRLYKRFVAHINDQDIAHDLCQTLWMRVLSNLPKYKNNDKFENFLNTIASNLIKDYWRDNKSGMETSLYDDEGKTIERTGLVNRDNTSIDEESRFINKEAVNTLIYKLIPATPCDQRIIYLLRHESEYWDDRQPMQWQHLADLNALDVEETCDLFLQARNKLIMHSHSNDHSINLECIENLIFLVWTQSQRVNKQKKLTEQYFADLLNIPVNTLKTRYRACVKDLSEGMRQWQQ